MVNMFVAISYGKGVVLCEQFTGKVNGQTYSDFMRQHFPAQTLRECYFYKMEIPHKTRLKQKLHMMTLVTGFFQYQLVLWTSTQIENIFKNV